MKNYDVQSVLIQTSAKKAFEFIASPQNLVKWTSAFKDVKDDTALLSTSNGDARIALRVDANAQVGNIDWYMTFPDGSVAKAFSRIVPLASNECIYSFVLLAPPVPLEMLEGVLTQQIETLRHELTRLVKILR